MKTRANLQLEHLASVAHLGDIGDTAKLSKPDDVTWHDYLVMLLHVAAEIEQALMVQYLYAAYSLGGEQVPAEPPELRRQVQGWQQSILAVAKEEMGHLLSVQNVLCLVGGPVTFDREDYPWDSAFYPFPFRLEPLTLGSLACYVYTEMPSRPPRGEAPVMSGGELGRIRRHVEEHVGQIPGEHDQAHHVGALYDLILSILKDPSLIRDEDLHPDTYQFQASWDEWGRGYAPPPVHTGTGEPPLSPHTKTPAAGRKKTSGINQQPGYTDAIVLLEQVATRTEAIALLERLAAQGEAPHLSKSADEVSHFRRFLDVYEGFEDAFKKGWNPARRVATNPTTDAASRSEPGYISCEPSARWANLFNLRYRMLLTCLTHSFTLARSPRVAPDLRGAVLHRAFAEMYNIKTIAGMLVRMPLLKGSDHDESPRAGPPFQLPYTLALPLGDAECWRLHLDLLQASEELCSTLQRDATDSQAGYLNALRDLDTQSVSWIRAMTQGPDGGRR